MKRIIIHWTGGANKPCSTDIEHYHFIIDSFGSVINGKFKPSDNENCKDGKYAQHCGGGNTGSIGVAMCGMYVPNNYPVKCTKYPLTKIQCERCFKLIAELSKQYNIPINPQSIMTHYEFGLKHPETSSKGKIDIIWLPPYGDIDTDKIGNFIRSKIRWYFKQL